MKRNLRLFLLCGVMVFMLLGCDKAKEITDKQILCEHQWTEVDWSIVNSTYTIYCPKCKLEKEVSSKKWYKIQADMKYRKNNEKKLYKEGVCV